MINTSATSSNACSALLKRRPQEPHLPPPVPPTITLDTVTDQQTEATDTVSQRERGSHHAGSTGVRAPHVTPAARDTSTTHPQPPVTLFALPSRWVSFHPAHEASSNTCLKTFFVSLFPSLPCRKVSNTFPESLNTYSTTQTHTLYLSIYLFLSLSLSKARVHSIV